MNNIYIYIIKLFLRKEFYLKYNNYAFSKVKNSEILKLLKSIENYYNIVSNGDIISVDNLELLFLSDYPALRNKELSLFQPIFARLREANPDPALIETYLQNMGKADIAAELAIKALDVSEGKVGPEVLAPLLERLQSDSGAFKEEFEFVSTDLDALLKNQVDKPGLKWRLDCLNRSLGPLRKGDFGFIFKRPETGGTTLLADQVTFMAGQTDKPVLWFNNEEQGEKVILRCYQAALGKTLNELYHNREASHKAFIEATRDNVKIIDEDNISASLVQKVVEFHKPSLIIFDQIDKISGFKEDRKDLEQGEIYKWARGLAKKHAPIIAVCQAAGTAENKMWLNMDDVAESKTSKQGEADWILGIGCVHGDGKRNLRYFSICKNKLIGSSETDEGLRHGQMTVLIQPEIARYKDIK